MACSLRVWTGKVKRIRWFCGRNVPGVLCQQPGAAGRSFRNLLPHADGEISGGDRFGARHRLAVCGLVFAARVSGIRAVGESAGAFHVAEDAQAAERGGARGGLRFRAGAAAGVGPATRQDAGRGCDDAGGARGDAHDRAARRRDGLRGVAGAAGAGVRDRDTDARRPGEAGPEASEEGLEQGLGASARP